MKSLATRLGQCHLVALAVGILVLVGVIVAFAHAQPGPPEGGMPMPPGGMMMPPMFGPPGGGGIGMLAHEGRIYIAQDGVLYKIDPDKMVVEGEVRYLRRPMGPGPGGPGGGPLPVP